MNRRQAARNLVEADKGKPITLEDWLETIDVMGPGQWENEQGPKGWYAVVDQDGIMAYFADETTALRFRLAEVNRRLNG